MARVLQYPSNETVAPLSLAFMQPHIQSKMAKGVPRGYKHNWKYTGRWSEKKVTPKTWKIDFRATKGKKAKGYGNFKRGFKIKWKINAVQYARKTGKGRYQTRMVGTKRLIKSGYRRNY